jgi:hypothetical protein
MRGSWNGKIFAVERQPYRPLRRLATIVTVLLAVSVAIDIAGVASAASYVSFFQRAVDGAAVTVSEAQDLDRQEAAIAGWQVLVLLVTGLFFIGWFRAAYRNLSTLGVRNLRFKPGWAVWSWMVPFLNTVRPKEIANDIWRGSDPTLPEDLEGPAPGNPVAPVINAWWVLFMVSGVLAQLVARTAPHTASGLLNNARLLLVARGMSAVAGIAAIVVVHAITSRQSERQRRLAFPAASIP